MECMRPLLFWLAVLPPKGFDDVSTLYRAEGQYGMREWMKSFGGGIRPELERIA